MWVPLKEKEKKSKSKVEITLELQTAEESFVFKFLSFLYFFLRSTETCPSEFVGINTKSALRDEGYA